MKMKRKVIRVCSLVLLSVAVSTTLVGCGSKSEKDTAASSTSSTSKVVKPSAKTKTSEKKSAKKAKSEASASKDSQGQEEASAPEASSSKNQASAGNDAQAGTNSSAASESNKSSQATADTQSDAPVPAALVGTWTGTSPQATDISFTVDADGNITSKANFNPGSIPHRCVQSPTGSLPSVCITAKGRICYKIRPFFVCGGLRPSGPPRKQLFLHLPQRGGPVHPVDPAPQKDAPTPSPLGDA